MNRDTSVRSFFCGKTLFLTGATGFVGRFMVYKLLKDLNVEKIYICLRPKKGVCFQDRIDQFKQIDLFKFLPDPSLLDKLVALEGDVTHPNLGLSNADQQKVINEVNIFYHSAATVRFNEPLKTASLLHVNGTDYVIQLCKRIKNLDIMIYVSSIGAWAANDVLEERVPEPPYDPLEFGEKFKNLSDAESKAIEHQYLGARPKYMNSYTLTKSLAESLVQENIKHFKKIAVVRPPFLMSPIKDPEEGWFDEPQTGAGLGALFSLGLLRMANLRLDYSIELIPIDMCVNALITITWYMHQISDKKLQVFNMNSSRDNPMTGRTMLAEGIALGYKYPSVKQIRPPVEAYHFVPTRHYIGIKAFFTHTLFAMFIDTLLFITGQKPMLYRLTWKLVNAVRQIFETMSDYKDELIMEMGNIDLIYGPDSPTLTPEERELFYYDVKSIDWISLGLKNHMRFRRHVLKEPDSNLEYARKRLKVIEVGYKMFKIVVWGVILGAVYGVHLLTLPYSFLWYPFIGAMSYLTAIFFLQ